MTRLRAYAILINQIIDSERRFSYSEKLRENQMGVAIFLRAQRVFGYDIIFKFSLQWNFEYIFGFHSNLNEVNYSNIILIDIFSTPRVSFISYYFILFFRKSVRNTLCEFSSVVSRLYRENSSLVCSRYRFRLFCIYILFAFLCCGNVCILLFRSENSSNNTKLRQFPKHF